MKTPMGSREITITVEQLAHASSLSRPCASVMHGWDGEFDIKCNFSQLLPDNSGQAATVVIGSTVLEKGIRHVVFGGRSSEDVEQVFVS